VLEVETVAHVVGLRHALVQGRQTERAGAEFEQADVSQRPRTTVNVSGVVQEFGFPEGQPQKPLVPCLDFTVKPEGGVSW